METTAAAAVKRRNRTLVIMLAVLLVLEIADVVTTWIAFQHGLTEWQPVERWFWQHGVMLIAWFARRTYPRIVTIALVYVLGVFGGVVAMNILFSLHVVR